MLAVTEALMERLASPETLTPGFSFTVERGGEGVVRVTWVGGIRNGVTVPDGDVSMPLGATYDHLIATLRGGGFMMGGYR